MYPHIGLVVALALFLSAVLACQAEQGAERVRPAECADDMWYPRDADALARQIDEFLSQADPPSLPGKPAALISPHAGIRYSGPTAAAAYKTVKGQMYKRVIVLGFSHRTGFEGGAILPKVTAYATPLGNIPVDRQSCDRLLKEKEFAPHEDVHHGEHSLEIQLPFLQRVLSGFQLVPILVGNDNPDVYDRMATAIAALVDDETLLVASSDFTHYGRSFFYVPFSDGIPENLKRIDFEAADRILALDAEGFLKKLKDNGVGNPNYRLPQTICGRGPITLLIKILNRCGAYQGVRLAYDTSGRMTNDYKHSVSYMALAFVKSGDREKSPPATASAEEVTLSPTERATLLAIARDAATAALENKGRIDPRSPKYTLSEAMQRKAGAFVTLKNGEHLRGCIGYIVAKGSLVDAVVDNAINAATRDFRFADNPVTAKEMAKIRIEISVMSPLRPVKGPSEIVLGKHGVVLTRGVHRSVFLPQVATETKWDLETFLSRLSLKAGLSADAWKQSGTQFEVFTAEVFGEPEQSNGAT